jgi:uncharacterized protein (DUF4213/DUF364 family)
MYTHTSNLLDDFHTMAINLATAVDMPDIAEVFLPPLFKGAQPHDSEFMAIRLHDDSVGISYVLLPEDCRQAYEKLRAEPLDTCSLAALATHFGTPDPIEHMLALATLNAMCSHVMRAHHMQLDTATDSLGLLNIQSGDHVGMVGFFSPLIKRIEACGARLTVIELDESYRQRFPDLHITLDTAELRHCNKILCTSTTVYNNTLDSILNHCQNDAFVSVIGPTAGFFPDPLFDRGVDVVGGTFIHEGKLFMRLLNDKQRWTGARRKICFQKKTYTGLRL